MTTLNLHGLIPAVVLPMTPDARPNLPAFARYLDWLIDQRPVGLAINADTGEGPHLAREERREVLETAVETARGRVAIVAGIGGPYTAAAVDQARDAQAAGADAMLMFPIPAYYGRPLFPDIPYEYHRAVANAVDLPQILFQLQPALGGVEYTPEAMARLLTIDTVVAIKEASFDAMKFVQMRSMLEQAPRRITLLTGNDNFICHSFVLGAEGALIGFGTLAADLQVQMIDAALRRDWDEAFRLSAIVQPLADVIFAQPVPNYRARTKVALHMLGVIDDVTVRPPLLAIDDADRARVRQALDSAGLLAGARV
ncbi:MAG: dihydrodipicolinate synthase family protein [Thermomicrobiales bacterium]